MEMTVFLDAAFCTVVEFADLAEVLAASIIIITTTTLMMEAGRASEILVTSTRLY
jgi:hypothetical protein